MDVRFELAARPTGLRRAFESIAGPTMEFPAAWLWLAVYVIGAGSAAPMDDLLRATPTLHIGASLLLGAVFLAPWVLGYAWMRVRARPVPPHVVECGPAGVRVNGEWVEGGTVEWDVLDERLRIGDRWLAVPGPPPDLHRIREVVAAVAADRAARQVGQPDPRLRTLVDRD